MKRADDILKQACARAAQEVTDALNRSLTLEEMRRAEQAYDRHKPKALSLIRKHTKKERRGKRALAAAACLALLLAGGYLTLFHAPRDIVPAAQRPAASVAPYYSPVPTFSPIPAETQMPEPTQTPASAPTDTPKPTETPPSLDTPAPTDTPTPTAAPAPARVSPAGWTGLYFPQSLPEGYGLSYLEQKEGRHTAAYTLNGRELMFTEYDSAQSLTVPEGAESRYVALDSGLIALRTEADGVVTLTWDQEGRTLSVAFEEGDGKAVADSVKKI